MNDALADSESTILYNIGRDLIQSIIALCVEAVVWTIYLVLAMISCVILFRKRRSRMAWFLFAIVFVMFVLDTTMFVIDIRNAVQEISYTLTSHSTLSLADRYALTDNLQWPVQSALYAFLANLGDVIVIWRVYAFYSVRTDRFFVLLPLSLLLVSCASSGTICFCVANNYLTDSAVSDGKHLDPPLCKNAQFTSYCLTLATTGVSTLLIGYKTWHYRRTIGAHLWGIRTNKSKIEKTMNLLLESGIIFFLFFLSAVVADTPRVARLEQSTLSSSLANRVWAYLTSHIICIYPVAVIIIVHSQHSYIDAATTHSVAVFVPDMVSSDLGALGVASAHTVSLGGGAKAEKAQGERASLERSSSYISEAKGVFGDVGPEGAV
ncbi:hypothetical protein PHLGIDRAFT_38176 [Phlebiopsis gigantea 11061_1 CR5-6]|uniref:G-protein coupled receptors family 1 profile domain-containing protein n=1 Tax=Phlebiopsis gigantea (strain 11061_1 CR5-6) TaxID=745531 RepID=A0A0C3NB92_PHLG1|nr:hypothetical protein PHLGIDRAFT_38176 [Phlebiopsis gigantea 11061_1 CR5-6]